MGKIARMIWEYDSMAEFLAEGGSTGYGDGNVVIAKRLLTVRNGRLEAISGMNTGNVKTCALYGDSVIAGGNSNLINVSAEKTSATTALFTTGSTHGLRENQLLWFAASEFDDAYTFLQVSSIPSATTFTATVSEMFPQIVSSSTTKTLVRQEEINGRNFVANLFSSLNANIKVLNCAGNGNTAVSVLKSIDKTINLSPNYAYIGFGINDITGGATDAQLIANIETAVYKLAGICELILLGTIGPLGQSANGYVVEHAYRVRRVNAEIKRLATRMNNVMVIDVYAAWNDGAGDWKTSYSGDAKHPSRLAALRVVNNNKSNFAKYFKACEPFVSESTESIAIDSASSQLITNPCCTGTGGTVPAGLSGVTLPNNWTASISGTFSTRSGTPTERSDGRGNNISVSVAGASEGAQLFIESNQLASLLSPGDLIQAQLDLSVTNIVSGREIEALLVATIGGVDTRYRFFSSVDATGVITENITGRFTSHIIKLPSGAITSFRLRINVRLAAGGGANIQAGCFSLTKL